MLSSWNGRGCPLRSQRTPARESRSGSDAHLPDSRVLSPVSSGLHKAARLPLVTRFLPTTP